MLTPNQLRLRAPPESAPLDGRCRSNTLHTFPKPAHTSSDAHTASTVSKSTPASTDRTNAKPGSDGRTAPRPTSASPSSFQKPSRTPHSSQTAVRRYTSSSRKCAASATNSARSSSSFRPSSRSTKRSRKSFSPQFASSIHSTCTPASSRWSPAMPDGSRRRSTDCCAVSRSHASPPTLPRVRRSPKRQAVGPASATGDSTARRAPTIPHTTEHSFATSRINFSTLPARRNGSSSTTRLSATPPATRSSSARNFWGFRLHRRQQRLHNQPRTQRNQHATNHRRRVKVPTEHHISDHHTHHVDLTKESLQPVRRLPSRRNLRSRRRQKPRHRLAILHISLAEPLCKKRLFRQR